ncbi:hypothetical protein EYV94_08085 [Puteibacter caeruleilacunae]|nr:hypothetical protein EYV94_08085 [Puteibacter caeruleilacunae]
MKNIGNFLVGSMSTLGLSESIQHVDTASIVPSSVIDSVEALISLVGGIVSTVVVAWLKSKWDKKSKKLKNPKK